MWRELRTVLLLATLALPASVHGAVVEVQVKDDRGKPVEDAVVYVTVPAATTAKERASAVMDQINQEFVPYVLAVGTGSAVNFPNRDNIRHHVYSVSTQKKFELPLYIGTPAAAVVFDQPGVIVLGCNIHDWMVGYIFIVPGAAFAKTAGDGRARIENVGTGTVEVRVWHPRLKVATETTGKPVTVDGGGTGETVFTIGLKREWRVPRPAGERYQRSN